MLDRYIQLIREGEIVAFPTETVYGLGADVWNPSAIRKVFARKERPTDNPLIVHVASIPAVEQFAREISADARTLMQRFWPGPLTLIFKKKPEVLDLVTAGLDTVGVRWPSHPLSQELIASAGPLAAPSANTSGRPSPTKAQHVREDFGEQFPVIDAGETAIGLESTVLDLSRQPYRVYRPGAVSAQEIEEATGKKVEQVTGDSPAATRSPGTKYTHYAPDATVRWLDVNETAAPDSNTLYLLHSRRPARESKNIIAYGSDYQQLARELYDRFRQADHRGYKTVAIEPFTGGEREDPLIPALENRIQKAVG